MYLSASFPWPRREREPQPVIPYPRMIPGQGSNPRFFLVKQGFRVRETPPGEAKQLVADVPAGAIIFLGPLCGVGSGNWLVPTATTAGYRLNVRDAVVAKLLEHGELTPVASYTLQGLFPHLTKTMKQSLVQLAKDALNQL